MRFPTRALAALLFIAPSVAAAQSARTAAVDSLFARYAVAGSPGCAVGVSDRGEPVLTRAYGLAELEHSVPNTPETIFEAGSVSKQFAAAAVLLLAQQGKLSLDDDVRKHVPELPRYERPLTIRDLFSHTSGLRDWGTVVAAAGWPRTSRVHTHDHVLDVISRQKSLNYTPGDEYSYTNTGYSLLAIIAERASGESLQEYSRKNIFEPLGMHSTQWRDDFTRVVKGRATAYSPVRGGGFRILMPLENVYGNGGLLTTVGDLLRWTENLETGRVGGPELLREMHQRARLNDGREIPYARGVVVTEYRGVPEVSHGGATAGYRAFLTRFPEQRKAVAVLCNTTNVDAEALAHRTADLFLGDALRDPPAARTLPIAPERLAPLAGLYRELRTLDPHRVEVGDGKLMMGGTELRPLADGSFAYGDSPNRVTFDLGPDGRPTAMRLALDDGDVVAFEPVAAAAPTPAQLADYVGRWYSEEAEVEYEVAIEDGKLQLRRRPGVEMELRPAYADAFTLAGPGSLVRFVRGPDGTVREMSFGMGRVRDLRFRRIGS